MSVLFPPQDHKELLPFISLVALEPRRFDLLHDGELALTRSSNGQRITTVFKRLVEQYRQLKSANGHKPAHTERCLEGLHIIASHDITGQAKKTLGSLPCRVAIAAREGLPPVKNLTASQCQQILTALSLEKEFIISSLGFFAGLSKTYKCDAAIEKIGGETVYRESSTASSFPAEKLSCHLFACYLRHSQQVGETKDTCHTLRTDQIPHFLREALQLADDGLLNKEDDKFIEILRHLRQKRLIREMADRFDHERHTANLGALEPLCTKIDFMKEAPSLSRLRRCLHGISGGTVTSDTFQPQEVTAIFDSLVPYIKEVNSIETRYREVYERLRELTNSRRLIHFRKMVHDSTTALPTEEDFSTSWRWKQAKSTTKPKSRKKGPKKAPKKKKSKTSRRVLQLPRSQKGTSTLQKEAAPVAEASPMPVAAPASPSSAASAPAASNYHYADRVLQFLNPVVQGETRDEIEHGFGKAVDRYVEPLAIETTWKEKDILYSIPGEMEYQGEVHRGVFTYCFDGKNPNRCYHRCFMRKPADEMIAEFSDKGFWKFDFPELRAVHAEAYLDAETAEDGSRVVKEYRNVVEIEDPRNGATIRLFKVKC